MKRYLCFGLCLCIIMCFLCGCDGAGETKGAYSQTLSDDLRAEILAYYVSGSCAST